MVVSGGFVAGIRAGKAYNTFPLMNGHVLPPESFIIDPWYLNFFNNMALVQFDHRLGAWLLAFLVPWFWWKIRRAAVSNGTPGGNAVAGGAVRADRARHRDAAAGGTGRLWVRRIRAGRWSFSAAALAEPRTAPGHVRAGYAR
jgi:hypothetical protein